MEEKEIRIISDKEGIIDYELIEKARIERAKKDELESKINSLNEDLVKIEKDKKEKEEEKEKLIAELELIEKIIELANSTIVDATTEEENDKSKVVEENILEPVVSESQIG